jgi:phage tail-like protein
MANFGTAASRYVVEIDGVAAIRASEVSGVGMEHTLVELHVGNRPNPILVRGNFKVNEVTFKHGHALNSAGVETMAWMQGFINGDVVERRNMRLVIMDEDGLSPVAEYDMSGCVPTKFMVETHQGNANDPSYFSFSLRPEDLRLY